jgi:hypothetical protein
MTNLLGKVAGFLGFVVAKPEGPEAKAHLFPDRNGPAKAVP